MALPHLPSTYTTRRNFFETTMVNRRTRESDFHSQWSDRANYFNKENVTANKKTRWESNASYKTSMDAWKDKQEKETKVLKLKRRRLKLADMLKEERAAHQAELAQLSPSNLNVDLMKERSDSLRSAREERRQEHADLKLLEHFRQNNPDLRKLEQKQHEEHVISEWAAQEEQRKQREEEERQKRAEFEAELLKQQVADLKLQKEREEEKRREEEELKDILKNQMDELRAREREANKLKNQEGQLMREQWELDGLEEQRRKTERDRKKMEFGRVLLRQHAAALKRRSRQVQEELEQDLQFLQKLSQQEQDDQAIQTARREKAQTDARWMKQVVEEQIRLEKSREAELDVLYQDEAARVWQQRETEWAKERAARERLMNEVLAVRQDQIQGKLESVKQQQQESLERREEILRDLQLANQMTQRDAQREEENKKQRKAEIEAQVTSRKERDYEARLKEEEEKEEERAAEGKYEELMKREAGRLTQRGFQPKQYGRKQAWM